MARMNAATPDAFAIKFPATPKRARAAGMSPAARALVAMWCDALRRVVERCDALKRAALPTVMSISPTRLIN